MSAGNKIKLVKVLTTKVREVSQPKAFVPPKSLKQKITNPATNTIDVYKILIPVCLMVCTNVACTLLF